MDYDELANDINVIYCDQTIDSVNCDNIPIKLRNPYILSLIRIILNFSYIL